MRTEAHLESEIRVQQTEKPKIRPLLCTDDASRRPGKRSDGFLTQGQVFSGQHGPVGENRGYNDAKKVEQPHRTPRPAMELVIVTGENEMPEDGRSAAKSTQTEFSVATLDIPQALAVRELCESHGEKLVPA